MQWNWYNKNLKSATLFYTGWEGCSLSLSLSFSQLIAENTFPHNNKLHNNNAICDDDDNIDFNTEML